MPGMPGAPAGPCHRAAASQLPACSACFATPPLASCPARPLQELKDIIAHVKPHALIGLSAAGPSWPEEVVRQLCAEVECPLIFPLSNPTDKAEITAEQAYK